MSRLWELNRELKDRKAQLRQYEKREEQLSAILRDVRDGFEGHIAGINSRITETVYCSKAGFHYCPYITGNISVKLEEERECGSYSDTNMSAIQDEIREELKAARKMIEQLESDIYDLNRAVNQEKKREEAEKKRLLSK